MRRAIYLMLILGLGGCAVCDKGTVLTRSTPARSNLALRPYPGTTASAEAWAARSEWPFVETGTAVDDVTFYSTMTYDEQFQYDRSVGLYRGAQTMRTGVFVR